jgi:hypothetical protein
MTFFEPDFLQFFKDLAPNNNKDWFDVNRKRYEEIVKIPFKKFVQHVISEMAKKDSAFKSLEAKDCIFRINRDVRFSKEKQPYKLMVSAVISPKGKKDKAINGVYFELTPEHVRVYGGVYEIEKDDLQIRQCPKCATWLLKNVKICPCCNEDLTATKPQNHNKIKIINCPLVEIKPPEIPVGRVILDEAEIMTCDEIELENELKEKIKNYNYNDRDKFEMLAKFFGKNNSWVEKVWNDFYLKK